MRQAIFTKYIGPTNFKGSRVKAYCQAGSLTLPWDDALNPDRNHDSAARLLAEKYGWSGNWVVGAAPEGNGNVYVCDDCDGFAINDSKQASEPEMFEGQPVGKRATIGGMPVVLTKDGWRRC